tara:strand:- start:783 stop:1160 length:378 start_codon:yes stop_codon:yes gene_type:complete
MNKQELVKQYFRAFETKDLKELKKIYATNVRLKDWEMEAVGRKAVLAANKSTFNSVGTICVDVQALGVTDNNAMCKILIAIDDDVRLEVLDIIEFDDAGKIVSIVASKAPAALAAALALPPYKGN